MIANAGRNAMLVWSGADGSLYETKRRGKKKRRSGGREQHARVTATQPKRLLPDDFSRLFFANGLCRRADLMTSLAKRSLACIDHRNSGSNAVDEAVLIETNPNFR